MLIMDIQRSHRICKFLRTESQCLIILSGQATVGTAIIDAELYIVSTLVGDVLPSDMILSSDPDEDGESCGVFYCEIVRSGCLTVTDLIRAISEAIRSSSIVGV